MLIIVQNMSVPLDRRVWQECQALVAAGYGVSVICPRGVGQPKTQVLQGVSIHTYPGAPKTTGLASYAYEFAYCWLRTLALSVRVLWSEGFDLIQACNPPDTYFLLALLYKPFGKRFVYDQHDLCPEVYRSRFRRDDGIQLTCLHSLERVQYRTADRVIVTNESYAEIARTRGRVAAGEITVVRSGPDPSRMRRGDAHVDLRRGRDYLCCWLGIMGPQDGVDELLESIRVFVHDFGRTDTQFAILGYGDCLEPMKALAIDLELSDYVTFTGQADSEMIAAYLSTAEIGLSADPLSPLNDVSTMNKTMEYMAFGVPVVAYDLKETRVSAEEAAVYVEPGNLAAYAKAVAALLDDPVERAEMAKTGRSRVEDVLAWGQQVPGYIAVFDNLLRGDRAKEEAG